jgi:dipeptidyl aminopeptidase/acylaminoacyl peptidase
MTNRAPFGTWHSPITADVATAGIKGFSSLSSDGRALYWLESRPDQGGRTTLVRRDASGIREITPAPFNVRSRVHEYGGGAYVAAAGKAFVVDFDAQNLHEFDVASGTSRQLTHSSDAERFADLIVDERRNRLICIREQHHAADVINSVASVDLNSGGVSTLHAGHDFYASPRISPDGTSLCFLSWDHPNMPWDGTQLHMARCNGDGSLGAATIVAGGASESVVQPAFIGAARRLIFASDRSGWWNLHSYDDSGLYCIHEDAAEYGLPPWQFGMHAFTPVSATHLACQRIVNGVAGLVLMDVESGICTPLETDWLAFDALTVHEGTLCVIGHRPDRHSAIVRFDLSTGQQTTIAAPGELPVSTDCLSVPELVAFSTRDGATAYAHFYPPRNSQYRGQDGERPPLLVVSHGGPTSASRPMLNFRIQYYTSRGWAVVDVNYRGSTGFGRAYRDHLKGRWGLVDVQDCEDAVAFLAQRGRVDADRVAIRGGSAGGYTTLAALCAGDRFKAGASHYGVGDLEALARDTHKFESRYLDSLIGPYDRPQPQPAQQALYRERSPIHNVDRLACPVIFLQGLKDRVVPPNQTEAMVAALSQKGLPVAYVSFPEEQHGFRDGANIRRAIESEHTFFARIFHIDAPGLTDLEIINL